uniref:JmjC domain-containing protein n=1 Tax=Phaeomonas parva TaxID=124430 RepID=A0A7S1U804_9STRA|mmetsp:Transcript_35377/g.111302  ORF Transcript_35377/g.111302 Transcript_35377/m.111302 type:complete len:435 (+) Transcript_35377:202-1506(+)|eukprot:CAMPEP_0118873132 /NCGR_PEP_ID=MMETSP1163-20130328/15058_1 /TAXON_ID=124430 /ORGANISM="Phaeomonas parva, Strain CCMP2877" /LENGTH=434 /DNA_ID=CAMNT_0006808389 /DNA_START=154 /DNA_END=1458 /DNA_ORIENTATION=-
MSNDDAEESSGGGDDGLLRLRDEVRWACDAERPHLSPEEWCRGGFGPALVPPEEDVPPPPPANGDLPEPPAPDLAELEPPPEVRFQHSAAWEALRAALMAEPEELAPRLDATAPECAATFRRDFEAPGRPVVLDNTAWPDHWTLEYFADEFPEHRWRLSDTHGCTLCFEDYMRYMAVQEGGLLPPSTGDDDDPEAQKRRDLERQQRQWELFADALAIPGHDAPLALYDSQFGEFDDELATEYEVPPCFGEDILRHADSAGCRPPYRWILIGPGRSGTGMHIDPLLTDAWLTLTEGLKRWVMFPPKTSWESIGLDPAAPQLEAIHWYQKYVAERASMPRAVEILQRPGECVYIPAGWLHCVLNLAPCVAITHNYSPEPAEEDATLLPKLADLWRAIQADEPELAEKFPSLVEKARPDLVVHLAREREHGIEARAA